MRKHCVFILHSDWLPYYFLNNRELVSGDLISTLKNGWGFAYHFQRHKQEMTQVNLVLQN